MLFRSKREEKIYIWQEIVDNCIYVIDIMKDILKIIEYLKVGSLHNGEGL